MLHVYVDGSYKDQRYGWSFIVLKDGEVIHQDSGIGDNAEAAKMRNVAGELSATMRACRWALQHGYKQVKIFHDYAGIALWYLGKWQARNPLVRQYVGYMQKLAAAGLEIEWAKVRAHSGNPLNERADQLTKSVLA